MNCSGKHSHSDPPFLALIYQFHFRTYYWCGPFRTEILTCWMCSPRRTIRLPTMYLASGLGSRRPACLSPPRSHLPVMGCHKPRTSLCYIPRLDILDGVHHQRMLLLSSSAVDAHGPARRELSMWSPMSHLYLSSASRRRDGTSPRRALDHKSPFILWRSLVSRHLRCRLP